MMKWKMYAIMSGYWLLQFRFYNSMDCIDHLPVLLSDTETPDCPFGCIIIAWNISICKKYPKIFFLIPRIANSITKFILLRHIYSF